MTTTTTKTTTKTLPTSKERFRKALDEVFAAGRAFKADNPSVSSFVSNDATFKVEFAGPELFSVSR